MNSFIIHQDLLVHKMSIVEHFDCHLPMLHNFLQTESDLIMKGFLHISALHKIIWLALAI